MYRTFLTKYAPSSFSLPPIDYYCQLCSPRSSSDAKTKALDQLEKHIAISCLAADDKKKKTESKESWDHFLALQYTFECNGASASLFFKRFSSHSQMLPKFLRDCQLGYLCRRQSYSNLWIRIHQKVMSFDVHNNSFMTLCRTHTYFTSLSSTLCHSRYCLESRSQ